MSKNKLWSDHSSMKRITENFRRFTEEEEFETDTVENGLRYLNITLSLEGEPHKDEPTVSLLAAQVKDLDSDETRSLGRGQPEEQQSLLYKLDPYLRTMNGMMAALQQNQTDYPALYEKYPVLNQVVQRITTLLTASAQATSKMIKMGEHDTSKMDQVPIWIWNKPTGPIQTFEKVQKVVEQYKNIAQQIAGATGEETPETP